MQAPLTLTISFIKLINSPFWHKPVASTVLETENFQIFKPDLEKAEDPEIKLPTSGGSQKKEENSRKTSIHDYYHKKELNCAIGRDMHGSRDCHTE